MNKILLLAIVAILFTVIQTKECGAMCEAGKKADALIDDTIDKVKQMNAGLQKNVGKRA